MQAQRDVLEYQMRTRTERHVPRFEQEGPAHLQACEAPLAGVLRAVEIVVAGA
jgi:hypothetical protein